jgi:hypothetical protein
LDILETAYLKYDPVGVGKGVTVGSLDGDAVVWSCDRLAALAAEDVGLLLGFHLLVRFFHDGNIAFRIRFVWWDAQTALAIRHFCRSVNFGGIHWQR